MLSRKQMNTILSKNYDQLSKAQKSKVNNLTRKITNPVLAPNNLPALLRIAIDRTSNLKGEKLSQEKYYDYFINTFDGDSLFRGKNDITSMSLNSFQKYFRAGERRPNPLRLHNLLSLCYLTANNKNYINDTYKYVQHMDDIVSFNYFSSIFKNQKSYVMYLKELLDNATKSTGIIANVLAILMDHPWSATWPDAYGKFGDVGMAKLHLIIVIKDFELKSRFKLSDSYQSFQSQESAYYHTESNIMNRILPNSGFKSVFPLASKYLEKSIYDFYHNKDGTSLLSSKEAAINEAFNSVCDQYTDYGGDKHSIDIQFNEQNFISTTCCKILESLFT